MSITSTDLAMLLANRNIIIGSHQNGREWMVMIDGTPYYFDAHRDWPCNDIQELVEMVEFALEEHPNE